MVQSVGASICSLAISILYCLQMIIMQEKETHSATGNPALNSKETLRMRKLEWLQS